MKTWEQAEEEANAYLEEKHGVVPVGVSYRYKALPFLLGMWSKPGIGEMVLVCEEGVVVAQGLDVLHHYLKEIALLGRSLVSVDDMLVLIQHLGAWPPIGDLQRQRSYFGSAGVRPELDPTFLHASEGACLTLHYEQRNNPVAMDGLLTATVPPPVAVAPPIAIGGGGRIASPRIFERWKLNIRPNYDLTWDYEMIQVER